MWRAAAVGRRWAVCTSVRCMSTEASALVSMAPGQVAEYMVSHGSRRAFAMRGVGAGAGVRVSHAHMDGLAAFLDADEGVDMQDHEGLFLEVGRESGLLMGAFLWWTHRGQACGGIRLKQYGAFEAYLRDGLRLATGMGLKSAMAGLWWGGGKGVIARDDAKVDVNDAVARAAIFRDYGRFLTGLRGCYVAAEDAGVNVSDVDIVYQHSRYTTCISPAIGGSGNPSVPTAAGVVEAMEGALAHQDRGTLAGKTIALQGVGNVGLPLVKFLLEKGVASIEAVDTPERVAAVRDEVKALAAASPAASTVSLHTTDERPDNAILLADADIISPCAFGGVLNDDTIPRIRSDAVVCGAANNQLGLPTHDAAIQAAGFTYVPDFVANRMGIVNCANEQYGRIGSQAELKDPAITCHLDRDNSTSVFQATQAVLRTAAFDGMTTVQAAERLAKEYARQAHPIWGPSRSWDIMQSLVADDWANSA